MTNEQTKILKNVEEIFLPLVREAFAENLLSVTLYGSAVKGRFVDGLSDVNTLIVLTAADPAALSEFGKRAVRTMKKNRVNPMILTEREYLRSADVFPMEYLDIQTSRKVIYGDDLTERLEITKDNLRHQVEEQLRGSVAALRRAMLGVKGKAAPMKRILRGWFGSQSALFRGLLRLSGVDELPADPTESIALLGRTYSVNVSGLESAARLRAGEKIDPTAAAGELLTCLTELSGKVDEMDT